LFRGLVRLAAGFAVLLLLASCGLPRAPVDATLWPEADPLFHADPDWIGGDGAYSVDLGAGRILWLFGDSFIAHTPARIRSEAWFVRNSVAIQSGSDPRTATMRFLIPVDGRGVARSFMLEDGVQWFWPGHGIRVGDVLLLFYERVQAPRADPSGFESAGWTARRVGRPDDDPLQWTLEPAQEPANNWGVQLGGALVAEGDVVNVFGIRGVPHQIFVGQFQLADLAAGDLSRPAWWQGQRYEVGAEPVPIISDGAPEFSVQHDAARNRWVMVESHGYGDSTIVLRTAPAPQGPWTGPQEVLRPPESDAAAAFVYAAKAHPELAGADMLVTYVPSSFDPITPADEPRLYYPRFVRVNWKD
jgi:hypothetical protein